AVATNFPLELFFLRDDDIPQYVEDGVADIGFVGENVVYEKCKKVEVAYALGFGKCRLSFAVNKNETFTGAAFLAGKKIATSYPVLVQKYLNENKIQAEIHEISGSVEIAPGIGLADAAILERLLFRIESVKKAKKNKYVLLNAPNANLDKIISLLPGMKSPTVVALATPGWSSVHSVIAESDFWEIIEKLKLAGAEGILVVPIEKMIL
ncbi:MAG: ATP phosphoribosyltransferase, partial [Chitinophagia bacterium]|nr:ATP phosphoribosyltransferase [Chitinophagia bacterium]